MDKQFRCSSFTKKLRISLDPTSNNNVMQRHHYTIRTADTFMPKLQGCKIFTLEKWHFVTGGNFFLLNNF